MAAIILTVAQQKGGAGKTTLAAHLAAAFQAKGRRVATVDIDPQASLSRWHEARAKALTDPGITHSRITGWRAKNEVEKLARSHDVVIIDSPPHAETEARIAVRAASLVIVPVQPSPMDVWATRPTLDLAAQERVPVLLVLNRVPARTRLADQLIARMADLGADVAATHIGNRISFAAALMDGRSVGETARTSRAAEEIEQLAAEILRKVA
jgi:chromosome partitioning protein